MWFIPLLIGLALTIVAYLIMPKPKREQPATTREDMDSPVVEAGAPVPVVFGTITIKSPNILWFGDKNRSDYWIYA